MVSSKKLCIALVGLGFGGEFVPIYQDHPDVASVAICDLNPQRLQEVGDKFNVQQRFRDVREIIQSNQFDAVHLISGIPEHAWQTVAVLNSGKHCACTVPMATSIEGLREIITAQKQSGKNYMMMETAVYTRQFLYAKALQEQGAFGPIQFLRGAHYQDMECWPSYWAGLPPMWYATHAISPLLAIANTRAVKVHCYGSGVMRGELHQQYQNPFPVETAIFQLEAPGLAAEVTRSLFHCARPYMESFVIYGENACYEWQMEDASPMLFEMSPVVKDKLRDLKISQPQPPDREDLLPASLAKYTKRFVYSNENTHLSFEQGGGHHGSHPHLVNEFVRSIVEERAPRIDAVTAANWTAAGICAHASALRQGEMIKVPNFQV